MYHYAHSHAMAKGHTGQSNGAWDTNDVLFDPLTMSPSLSSKSHEFETTNPDFVIHTSSMNKRSWDLGRVARGGKGCRGLFTNMRQRQEEEDESHYFPEYNSGITRILSLMQIIMGVVIILIGIFAYVAKATIGPMIPAMDIGCGVVLYITGGVLGIFTKCRAKRMVAAFILLSSCSFVSSTVLGAIHALAGFQPHSICAYLHCGSSPDESSRQVMDSVIAILSFIEAVFALVSVIVGVHGFCKWRHGK
ncbi:uncharacterized protein LOC121426936 isoform X1 [Lytechinus variegatus]|uniref:uncharacterized protein LOC121426936 isoform X1 n=2 Tax=Lytechinus variegatus TaxID=7654 RepID=UPI001BB147E7|nr:uncharacterized protein LOC121426936 isoform X1 [Lytechinus variegatus]